MNNPKEFQNYLLVSLIPLSNPFSYPFSFPLNKSQSGVSESSVAVILNILLGYICCSTITFAWSLVFVIAFIVTLEFSWTFPSFVSWFSAVQTLISKCVHCICMHFVWWFVPNWSNFNTSFVTFINQATFHIIHRENFRVDCFDGCYKWVK